MRRIILIVLIVTSVTGISFSQMISQDVIASSGDYFIGSNVTLSWTLGECVIETFPGSNTILTQGFQQPDLYVTSIIEFGIFKIDLTVYPNPVTNNITIEVKERNQSLKAEIMDLNGKILYSNDIIQQNHTIDFTNFAHGIYLLKIIDLNNKEIKIFKVLKQ